MQTVMLVAIAAAGFTTYPGFGDRVATQPPVPGHVAARLGIEAIVDRGPIVEMIVRCRAGSAIISYSKVDKVYCSPKMVCGATLEKTISTACGASRG